MNEQKLREMMKIYTVSKQVNKKAEKNFLKFSHQFYKMHKADMAPELLNEINSLRQQIKVEKQNFSKQTSPIISPRHSENPKSILPNQTPISDLVNENKQKLDSIVLEAAHAQIFKLYIEEIKDLKQQLNKANQMMETQKKQYDIRLETINNQLVDQKRINEDLKKDVKVLKQMLMEKLHTRQITEISNKTQNESLEKYQSINTSTSNSCHTRKKSLEDFKSEIEQALNIYRLDKQTTQCQESRTQK
ncbi:unnamed protein product (macronuclear) [Paramecium tetraurelia]|uniref:Uncharacterized protein n=1 Tax=Paramecium tetraurelia TaxID=5888 RepID=A0BMG7_PARTE|nr:uncharacterized protein GSPATT00030370001 [Paramecium tetraurelia]CAK59734.1 unnamed protein product [Paramecium tetraurelia]|eukprot:XP_001427132.1 hypothetical protein (macronuclear) [Paramecium tetraurelia strain d4-2]